MAERREDLCTPTDDKDKTYLCFGVCGLLLVIASIIAIPWAWGHMEILIQYRQGGTEQCVIIDKYSEDCSPNNNQQSSRWSYTAIAENRCDNTTEILHSEYNKCYENKNPPDIAIGTIHECYIKDCDDGSFILKDHNSVQTGTTLFFVSAIVLIPCGLSCLICCCVYIYKRRKYYYISDQGIAAETNNHYTIKALATPSP